MPHSEKMGGQVYFVKYPRIDGLEIQKLVVSFFSYNALQGHPYFSPHDGENIV